MSRKSGARGFESHTLFKMMIQKDIFGVEPEIGDTIVWNPANYKGLVHYKCSGFTKSGLPELDVPLMVNNYGSRNKNGKITPKTGFVVRKLNVT